VNDVCGGGGGTNGYLLIKMVIGRVTPHEAKAIMLITRQAC